MNKVENLPWKEIEKIILEESADTFHTVDQYAIDLGYANTEKFIDDIKGKRLLDAGSGYGGLAKSVFLQEIACEVISINPRITFPRYEDKEHEANEKHLSGYPLKDFKGLVKDINGAQEYYQQRLIPVYAHNLYKFPQIFPDDSFDLILDNFSISFYSISSEVFQKSIQEMIRVLKPGGRILIHDPHYASDGKNWREEILEELGFEHRLITWNIPFKKGEILGVEITKA